MRLAQRVREIRPRAVQPSKVRYALVEAVLALRKGGGRPSTRQGAAQFMHFNARAAAKRACNAP